MTNRLGRWGQDRASVAAMVGVALAVPVRLWSIAWTPGAAAYAVYPEWAQVATLLAYVAQGAAEWHGARALRIAAAMWCVGVSGASAALFFVADPCLPNAVGWGVQAAIELWIVWRLGQRASGESWTRP